MSNSNSLDFALRTTESIAFSIHALLGLTEPCTGCLRYAFRDNGAMPSWFWPVAGAILLLVAYANFSPNAMVVLVVQAYIAAFHTGAVLYHLKLDHHPAAGLAPSVFVLIAFLVVTIRTTVMVALLGLVACILLAMVLAEILVRPNVEGNQDPLLENGGERALSEEHVRGSYTRI